MITEKRISSVHPRAHNAVLLFCTGLCGLAATAFTLRTQSEPGAAFLFGYSIIRLAAAAGGLLAAFAFLLASTAVLLQPRWWQRLSYTLQQLLRFESRLFILVTLLFTALLFFNAVLVLALSQAASELVILKTILGHFGGLIGWSVLSLAALGMLVFLNHRPQGSWKDFFTTLRLALLVLIAIAIYAVALKVYMTFTWDIRMRGMEGYLFLPVAVLLMWGLVDRFFHDRAWHSQAVLAMQLLVLGVMTFALYRHTAQWMEWQNTPSKAYWDELAKAFLQGRLYLANPSTTYDLTLYQGRWYVPMPPLPALVMMPFMALWGSGMNTVVFSIGVGAVNTVLVFWMLEQATRHGLVNTTRATNLWITVVLAFGTTHWWLSIMGRAWFLSQLLALMFAILAVGMVIRRESPWYVGLFLGLALFARPNMFTLWPFLAGLALHQMQSARAGLQWKPALSWAVQSAVPVCVSVAGLLLYNYLRFDDFLDFGYVTVNSADWIMNAVRTYGMFNVHFIPANLQMMFLKLPLVEMRGSCFYFSPTREGFSMLAMTPAILYIFRRWKWSWWTAGAWGSILLSVALLSMYHNNGAWQLGYRYLMDFILPVLLLLAVGIGQRASWGFRMLALLSIAVNGAAIIWWFEKWWC